MKVRDKILGLLPMGEALVYRLIDGTADEIDAVIKQCVSAKIIGRRECPTTGRVLLVDRRSLRIETAEAVPERQVKRASFRHQPKRTPAQKIITAMLQTGRLA